MNYGQHHIWMSLDDLKAKQKPLFADWREPVFDGPSAKERQKLKVFHNIKLNTECDE